MEFKATMYNNIHVNDNDVCRTMLVGVQYSFLFVVLLFHQRLKGMQRCLFPFIRSKVQQWHLWRKWVRKVTDMNHHISGVQNTHRTLSIPYCLKSVVFKWSIYPDNRTGLESTMTRTLFIPFSILFWPENWVGLGCRIGLFWRDGWRDDNEAIKVLVFLNC